MDSIVSQELKNGYFKPVRHGNNFCITKQFIIETMFPNLSKKRQQKILKKAKKMNIWKIENNIFEPFTIICHTCRKGCQHRYSNYAYDVGECYDNQVYYKRELLKLKMQNILDEQKDKGGNWINTSVIRLVVDLFAILTKNNVSK
jgi:hypothetical protein